MIASGGVCRHEPFPLTEIQQAHYVGRRANSGGGAHIYLEFDVDQLDLARLERAWNLLVAETDMLRAVVLPDGRQRVQERVPPYQVEPVDLARLPEGDRTEELTRMRDELARATFDPHRWPPFAVRMAGLPDARARIFFAIDEMVVDGPSVSLLFQRWHWLYRDLDGGHQPDPPPPATVTFRDYALALAALEEGPSAETALNYWLDKLADIDLTKPAPFSREGPGRTGECRRTARSLPAARWSRLTAYARAHGATPSALLLGLYAAAFRLESGVAGPLPLVLTTYNRQPLHPDVRRMIGPFISTSIFLVPPAEGRFDELLAAIQHQLWNDLEHNLVSGIRVLRERARRDPGQRGAVVPFVFTSMLGSLVAGEEDQDSWARRIDTDASLTRTPGVLLEAIAQEQDGGLRLFFDHDAARLDTAVAERIADRVSSALEVLASLPEEQPGSLVRHLLEPPTGQRLPLTDVQSAYLAGRMADPGGGADTRVYQELLLHRHDPDRVEGAWRKLVRQHPMLRAVPSEDGTVLVVDEAAEFTVPRHDLSTMDDGMERFLLAVRTRMASAPLPLGRWPFFAVEISVLPRGRLVLHATLDALVADARSLALVFEQLFRLHDGETGVLTMPRADYAEHARRRAQRAQGQQAIRARDQWRRKFEALPAGPPLNPVEGSGAKRVHRRVDLDGWPTLAARAEDLGVPADILLLTAYCDVLREEFGDGPFTVVVVSWDRPAEPPGAETLVGDFTQLAWLVIDGELPAAFTERVRVIWDRVREDLERGAMLDGLGVLRRQVFRSGGRLRLPVVFTRPPFPHATGQPRGVEVRYSQSQTAGVALDHVTMTLGETLICQWDAIPGALPGHRLDELFGRYAERVRAIAGQPRRLPPDERRLPPDEWNRTARDLGGDGTLAGELEAALQTHAGRVAVRFGDQNLSYLELDRRSARLAQYLIRRGCRPGDQVAVQLDRGTDLVVALLAVVRAGAAWVPLDPVNPPERLRFLLKDSEARLMIAGEGKTGVLAGTEVICPGRDKPLIDRAPDTSPGVVVRPDDPVYTIYTSGTTGQPKGCRNSHRGLTNRLRWMQERFRLTPADRVAQKTPFGFDVSVWEFFWPLLAGASVVVARPGGHLDMAYLVRFFREQSVTVTHFVPSMLAMFLGHPDAVHCGSLKYVFASGEELPAATMNRFFGLLPGSELHNLYGPTEAAIDVTHWPCQPGWSAPSVPLGRPIANTQIYLLDEQLRPVPLGAEGEIYLGGYGVALGYHKRPQLDAERFVRSPFADCQSERLYRTGDLGRFGPEGLLYFLGRNDDQFKVRGMRVEAGEVEAALTAVPGVREARVLLIEDPVDDPVLAALCLPEGAEPEAAGIRALLAEKLPLPAVPSRIRFVERFPLTPNGKLDRPAAAALVRAGAGVDSDPGIDAESIAAEAATLLGRERVGTDEDLFGLGATSFTMIRLAQAVLDRYGVEIPVDVLIEQATPRGIAARVSGNESGQNGPDLRIAFDAGAKAGFTASRPARRDLPPGLARRALATVPDSPAVTRQLFETSSFREFDAEPLGWETLRTLLEVFGEGEIDGRRTRSYPSAGGCYPVQIYLYTKPGRVRGLSGGFHYLDPVERSLVTLTPDAVLGQESQVRYNRPLFEGAAFGLFLVSTPKAIAPAYGTRLAERYTVIEAGHLAQLVMEHAVPLGLGLCPIGEMDTGGVRRHCSLGDDQDVIVSLWGGGLAPEDRARHERLIADPGRHRDEPIAVIGFAARLPGIHGDDCIDALAALLDSGGTAIGPIPANRWPGAPRTDRPGAAVGAYLDDVAGFVAAEFGLSDEEAAAVDPQERLLLQTVRACLADAATASETLSAAGPVGVFTGAMWQDYSLYGAGSADGAHPNRDGLATRVSHAFNLTGPSVVLDAGCVSGLAAIDAGCKAIRRGDCAAAVAGAANLVLHPHHVDFLAEVGLLAETADSCAFSDRASGWILGEGVAAVLLKPLSAALADGDPVHAVIIGSALRHAGTTRKYGLPNATTQREVIWAALADAGVPPASIGYVEAAASGAALADALEVRSLAEVFADRRDPVVVGSVKPTLGHMEAASVFGQLARVLAQFRHGRIFPTRLTSAPSPALDGGITLALHAVPWPPPEREPRRALINGLAGTGGYGCLVVEEPPRIPEDASAALGEQPDGLRRLALAIEQETGLEPAVLTPDADLLALGVDSRQLLRVAKRVEAEHGRRIPLEVLYEAASLGELALRIFGLARPSA